MLMEHFYRCLREDEPPPAQALRAAQRWLRDTTNREGRVLQALQCGAVDFFTQVMSRDPESRDFVQTPTLRDAAPGGVHVSRRVDCPQGLLQDV
jgi:CHAT domain-containing protein